MIIAQAGNSGGTTATATQQQVPTHLETFGIVSGCILLVLFVVWLYRRARRAIDKRVQERVRTAIAELSASREAV